MVVEMACECGDLPAHSHIWKPVGDNWLKMEMDPYEVHIWVDWKAIARASIVQDEGAK